MKTAAQQVKEQRELLGEKIGRFEMTEIDVSEGMPRGPFMVLSNKEERVVLRYSALGWWFAQRSTIHHMGWLVDEEPMCAAETLAGLIEKIREVAK